MKKPFIIILAVFVILGIAALAYSKYSKQSDLACTSEECMTKAAAKIAGAYVMKGVDADDSKVTRTLRLLPGGTLSLESKHAAEDDPAVVEIGSWNLTDSTHVNAVITGKAGEQYSISNTILLEKKGSKLVATSYDTMIYGTGELSFSRDESYKNDAPIGGITTPLPGRDGTDDTDPNAPTQPGYGGPVDQPITTTPITLQYSKVTLSPGASAKFADGTMKLGTAIEDSRCPTGVQCIWAGTVNATVDVTSSSGTVSKKLTLDTTESAGGTVVGNLIVSLIDAKPYPQRDQTIAPASYALTFNVQRNK